MCNRPMKLTCGVWTSLDLGLNVFDPPGGFVQLDNGRSAVVLAIFTHRLFEIVQYHVGRTERAGLVP